MSLACSDKLNELLRKNLAPPIKLKVSEFSEAERRLSPENSAVSGKWHNIAYQVEMQDVFNDKTKKIAVFMTGTQVGKTSVLQNIIAYTAIHDTGGITFMLPSESIARDFSKAIIAPLIRDTPVLFAKIPESRKDGNTHLFKAWPGGYLRMVGSQKADKISSFPSPFLMIDELDRCNKVTRNSAGVVEGSPIDLFLERSKNWAKRFALFTSTPTIESASAIEEWWEKSDQRKPYIPCIHCGHFQFLEWSRFEWLEKDASSVCFRCESCKKTFDEKTRNQWLKKLKWVKHNSESEIAGFHLNAFYSPWTSWKDLITKFLDCGSNQVKKMVWWNTTLGLPFSLESIKAPDSNEFFTRKKSYGLGEIPPKVSILLAACDVQQDRLEVSVIGFYKSQSFVIAHLVLMGQTSNPEDECWEELDQLLQKNWVHPKGGTMQIHRLAVDAHYNTTTVGQYARKRKKVVPVTGMDTNWATAILPSRPMEVKLNGKHTKTGKRRWPIGVSIFKMDLYNRLKLKVLEDGTVPAEYIDFADGLTEEYFKQLTGEVCKLESDARGKPRMVWEKVHDAVEALDCFVYVLALYKICGLHLWDEARWDRVWRGDRDGQD